MEDLENFALRLKNVYSDQSHPPENLKKIMRYMKKAKHSGIKSATLALNYSTFKIFSEWCAIPFDDLTEDDILNFLDYLNDYTYTRGGKKSNYSDASIHTFKINLKKFFGTIGKPEIANVFKDRARKLEEIDRKDLLAKSEIESLIQAANNARDKAIISTLYEAGCRRGELLAVRIKDLDFNDNGVKVTFPKGKTGKRILQLVYSASFLRAWCDVHPCRQEDGEPDPTAQLFVNLHGTIKKNGERVFDGLSEQGLYFQIQKIAKRINLKKKVNPHSFRHARATDLAEHMTEQQLKKFLGWTPNSAMASVYVHDPETDNAVLKMYGIETEKKQGNQLKVNRCPRCKDINPETSKFCGKCGLPLTQEAATTKETTIADYVQRAESDEILEMKRELEKQREEVSKLRRTMLKAGK